jgi:hypothetical protein
MKRTLVDALIDWHFAWDLSESTWAWCCHHDVELEPLVAPVIERLQYILTSKPKSQWIQRIDNFRPVSCAIPLEVCVDSENYEKKLIRMVKAYKKYSESVFNDEQLWQEYRISYDEYTKAAIAYIKKLKQYAKVLKKAHNFDVPGNTWNGKNIFKKVKKK